MSNGVRYDWQTVGRLVVPSGAEHQHFNTGTTPVRYLSAMSVHLDRFCGLHRHMQLEERGPIRQRSEVPGSADNMEFPYLYLASRQAAAASVPRTSRP